MNNRHFSAFFIVLLSSLYIIFLFSRGLFSGLLDDGTPLQEIERIEIIRMYIEEGSPNRYYGSHFGFYNKYMSILSSCVMRLLPSCLELEPKVIICLVGRVLTAVFVVCTLVLIILICKKLFKIEAICYYACIFFVLNPVFFQYSTTGLHHTHSMFWFILTNYFVLIAIEKKSLKYWLLSGFLNGLILALMKSSVPLLLLTTTAIVFIYRSNFKLLANNIGVFFIGVVSALIVGIPCLLSKPLKTILWQFKMFYYLLFYQKNTELIGPFPPFFSVTLKLSNFLGLILYLFLILGIFLFIHRLITKKSGLLERFQFFYIMLCLFFIFKWDTNVLPARILFLLPLLCITAAFALHSLVRRLSRKIVVIGAVFLIIFSYQFIVSISTFKATGYVNPTRYRALKWIDNYHRNKSILLPRDYKIFCKIPSKNHKKTFFYDHYHFDKRNLLFSSDFDLAIVENLDILKPNVSWREHLFRKRISENLGKEFVVERVFENKPKVFGINWLYIPFNDPSILWFSPRVFVIKRMDKYRCGDRRVIFDEYKQKQKIKVVINAISHYSDSGFLSIEQIVRKINSAGANALIITDFLSKGFKYQWGPFSKRMGSKLDIHQYLEEINQVQKKFPEILIIPGVKCIPHYYFSGSPLKFNLTINNGSKHLLLIGLDKRKSYFKLQSLLENNDIFNPDKEERKAQLLIDKAINEDLLVFWSHPGNSEFQHKILADFIRVATDPYTQSIILTKNFHGFGIPCYGIKTVLAEGGYDKLLLGYIQGERESPVWIIGESDFGRYGYRGEKINVFTVIEVNKKTPEEILSALRKGKCYVVHADRCGNSISLEKFQIQKKAERINVRTVVSKSTGEEMLFELVHNGKIIHQCRMKSKIVLDKEFTSTDIKGYFRIVVRDTNGGFLVSNPLFYEL